MGAAAFRLLDILSARKNDFKRRKLINWEKSLPSRQYYNTYKDFTYNDFNCNINKCDITNGLFNYWFKESHLLVKSAISNVIVSNFTCIMCCIITEVLKSKVIISSVVVSLSKSQLAKKLTSTFWSYYVLAT
jgi:hypothetical protein